MTPGDYFVLILIALNASAAISYGWQGYPLMAFYWFAAFQLNCTLLLMRLYGVK